MKAFRRSRAIHAVLAAVASSIAAAQPVQQAPTAVLDPLVVTATRSAERALDIPAAIDVVDARQIQQGQLQVNLSESLARVPGMFIQNRWNYAQDLMLSIRGFGARANFGVRGVRLYQDYIPVDDAGWPGANRQLQPRVGAAHRSVARAVLDALWKRVRRRHIGVHRGRSGTAAGVAAGDRRQLRDIQPRREDRRADGSRQFRDRRQPLRDRRLPRPQRGAARASQRETDLRAWPGHAGHVDRQYLRPALRAGPIGPHARAVGSESAPGGSGRHAVRYAQDRPPDARRRHRRAEAALRQRLSRNGVWRNAHRAAVPLLSGDCDHVIRRRHRSRPHVRRHRRARHDAVCDRRRARAVHAGRGLRIRARGAQGIRQRQRDGSAICAATKTTP